MCATWSGDFTDQTLDALGDVTVILSDGGVANDTLTVTSASCTFRFGTVTLGSTGFVTGGTVTFSGSTVADEAPRRSPGTRRHTLSLVTLGHARRDRYQRHRGQQLSDVHARRPRQERLRHHRHRHVHHRDARPVLAAPWSKRAHPASRWSSAADRCESASSRARQVRRGTAGRCGARDRGAPWGARRSCEKTTRLSAKLCTRFRRAGSCTSTGCSSRRTLRSRTCCRVCRCRRGDRNAAVRSRGF